MQPTGSAVGRQTVQFSQIAGLLAGGGLVAALGPYRALALDSLSFSLSAGILACWVRPRPAPPAQLRRPARPPVRSPGQAWPPSSAPRRCACLVLFGWLAGFTVVPEGLAAPYARTLDGGPPTIGLLLAAAPAGLLIGAFVLGRLIRPSDRLRPMGWLAMLSCAPLIFCQVRPPLPMVTALWALAWRGRRLPVGRRGGLHPGAAAGPAGACVRVAQAGLLAAQVLGILAAGAVAQRLGPQTAVTLAGLLGLVAAAVLATDWIHRHARGAGPAGRPIPPAHRPRPAHRPTGPAHRPTGPAHRPTGPAQTSRTSPKTDRTSRPPAASRQPAGQPAAGTRTPATPDGARTARPARPPMPASIAPAERPAGARCACRVRCSAAGAPTGRRGTCPGKPG